jgi:hypothetical protein
MSINEGQLNSNFFALDRADGYEFWFGIERVNTTLTLTAYTDDTYTTLASTYGNPGAEDATCSITLGEFNPFRYLYLSSGFATPFGTAPRCVGQVRESTLYTGRGTTWARSTMYPDAADTIVLSDTAPEPRAIWRGNCSDAIVFNDTAEIIGTFQGRAEDTIEFSDGPPRVAWIETLTEGIVFGDSTIWIRPFNKDEIDVQPKMVDFTFKAIAKITNFKAFKKQLATDAIELSLAAPIKIKPQTTDFKALNVVSDFKATEKKFDTTDNSLRRGLK